MPESINQAGLAPSFCVMDTEDRRLLIVQCPFFQSLCSYLVPLSPFILVVLLIVTVVHDERECDVYDFVFKVVFGNLLVLAIAEKPVVVLSEFPVCLNDDSGGVRDVLLA